MSFDPQKFFIGLMDFFSILMPGALLTFLLMGIANPAMLGERWPKLEGAEGWAAFLFASYLFGHLVFLLGSWLDLLYDLARRYTLNTQISLLARRDRLLPWPVRALIWLVFKDERNLAVNRAVKIKEKALISLHAADSINAFQWCKALLNVESPLTLAVVQRLEADSKFFRSLSVVLGLVVVVVALAPGLLQKVRPLAGICVLVVCLLLTVWRYMEQRFKSTNQTYWSIITITARAGNVRIGKAVPAPGTPTHAGGVVFRTTRGGETQYLLVEAKDDPSEWVLPKGHVEESEDYHETAVREVREETGVWAGIGPIGSSRPKTSAEMKERIRRRVASDLGNKSYRVNGEVVVVRFYLMQALGRGVRQDMTRRRRWFTLQQALEMTIYDETRDLLKLADTTLKEMQGIPRS